MKVKSKKLNVKSREERVSRKNSGQVMLLVVVTLGSILLSASAISGILLIYQIRNTNDSVNSAKAIFAADAGIEVASFCYFGVGSSGCDPDMAEAMAKAIEFDDNNVSIDLDIDDSDPNLLMFTSRGLAAKGNVIRIFEAFFAP